MSYLVNERLGDTPAVEGEIGEINRFPMSNNSPILKDFFENRYVTFFNNTENG